MRAADLVKKARLGQPNTFMTLTVNPSRGFSPDDRARRLAKAWRKLRALACKKYGYKRIPFLAVFEKHKSGEPHLHILARVKWIDQDWLSRTMALLTGAPIVDIRRVRSRQAIAAYITKYVGKDPTRFKFSKRYWCSQDWDLPDPNPWQSDRRPILETLVFRGTIHEYFHEACRLGWGVYEIVGAVYWFSPLQWAREHKPPRPVN